MFVWHFLLTIILFIFFWDSSGYNVKHIHSFKFVYRIPLTEYASLPVLLLIDMLFIFLKNIMSYILWWISSHISYGAKIYTFLFGIYLRVELWGHGMHSNCFLPINIYTNRAWEFQLNYIFTDTYVVKLIFSYSSESVPIKVLIYLALIINWAEILFCLLAILFDVLCPFLFKLVCLFLLDL